jgi:CYTH domain-containing protein
MEIEKKFLIDKPSDDVLCMIAGRRLDITQTYLKCDDELSERRVRKTVENGESSYYLTQKTIPENATNLFSRYEDERKISKEEYELLLKEKDESINPLHKTRYVINYNEQHFELDTYPFSHDKAVMEIELPSENTSVSIPPFIHVLEDVTDKAEYKNHALARNECLMYMSEADAVLCPSNMPQASDDQYQLFIPEAELGIACDTNER